MFKLLKKILSRGARTRGTHNCFGGRTFDVDSPEAQRTIRAFSPRPLADTAEDVELHSDRYGYDYSPPSNDACKFLKRSLVPIFPASGYGFYRERQSGWFRIRGGWFENVDGSDRNNEASNVRVGDFLYFFWEKDNDSDQHAVAVFRLPKNRGHFKENNQIGYVPRDKSERILEIFNSGHRVLAEVRRKYAQGDGGIKIIVTTYRFEERGDNVVFRITPKDDLAIRLLRSKEIRRQAFENLGLAGLLNYERLKASSDKEILSIEGVGKKTLSILRGLREPR
ncbi:hypothetical protein LJC59_01035 [Desulfovibrio sp. OttesenSCG-928-A18]|nr:hypothetical protein [Desulfovibrio sp. OttesenSCG-928-A18]